MTFKVSSTVVTADLVDEFISTVTTDKYIAFIVTPVGNNKSDKSIDEYVIHETSNSSITMSFCNRLTNKVEVASS